MCEKLSKILQQAANSNQILAGFNVFSLDWAKACIAAAEETQTPIMIMTNKAMVEHYGVAWLGKNLSALAQNANIDVFVHLDHCRQLDIIQDAVQSGYDSVMYDGSYLDLAQNIANSKQAAIIARDHGCLIEGEVGSVAYTDEADTYTEHTKPEDAAEFCAQTKVDSLAVSVGSIHRSMEKNAIIDYERLSQIGVATKTPLVIHGTSSIKDEDMQKLRHTRVSKFNLGTELRIAYANRLRELLTKSEIFDKLQLDAQAYMQVQSVAKEKILQLK